jgi:hypothetical protein
MEKLLDIYNIIKEEENKQQIQQYQIYCDMDGVLTDFEARFEYFSGENPKEYQQRYGDKKFWDLIDVKVGVGFWAGMKWMSDGKQLWKYIQQYNPILLSAPSKNNVSRLGKRVWVKNNLAGTKLILSSASTKKQYSGKNHILIDDRADNIQGWISEGGIGILHTSTENTIQQLKKLGL